MISRVVAAAACVLFALTAPAAAQTAPATPAPASAPSMPPGAAAAIEAALQRLAGDLVAPYGLDPNHVRGVVTYYRRFDLQIRMPLNRYEDIHLHQGTVINPRGTTLTPGQIIDIHGQAQSDGSLNADQITLVH
jgi:hypothetical protein